MIAENGSDRNESPRYNSAAHFTEINPRHVCGFVSRFSIGAGDVQPVGIVGCVVFWRGVVSHRQQRPTRRPTHVSVDRAAALSRRGGIEWAVRSVGGTVVALAASSCHAFHHANLLHLFRNVSFLWFLGPLLERRMRVWQSLLFWFSRRWSRCCRSFSGSITRSDSSGVGCAMFGWCLVERHWDAVVAQRVHPGMVQWTWIFLVGCLVATILEASASRKCRAFCRCGVWLVDRADVAKPPRSLGIPGRSRAVARACLRSAASILERPLSRASWTGHRATSGIVHSGGARIPRSRAARTWIAARVGSTGRRAQRCKVTVWEPGDSSSRACNTINRTSSWPTEHSGRGVS